MPTARRIGAIGALTLAASLLLTGCAEPPTAEIGTCLSSADLESEEVDSLNPIDCASPHDLEVFAKDLVPDGDYPGTEAIIVQGDAVCEAAFTPYVGTDYWESALDFTYLYPIEESWQIGDREILCMLYSPDEVTTSLKGSNL